MKFKLILLMLALGFTAGYSQIKLQENFDYNVGALLTASGWNITGTSVVNEIAVVAPGLTYPGYPMNSGNAAKLMNTGQDINRGFMNNDSVVDGSLYASVLVNLSAANTAGDYFMHFGIATTNSSVFMGRVFARLEPNGKVAFGLSKSSVSATILAAYSDSIYALNTTHLLVLKYKFGPATDDDSVFLFINPNVSTVEPIPTLSHGTSSAADPLELRTFNLRQGTASNAPTMTVDGIVVATSWSSVVPVELTSFTASVSGKDVTLNWATATETNNSGFYVEMAKKNADFNTVTFVQGKGTTTEQQNYAYTVSNLSTGKYQFRLKQVDHDGSSTYTKVIETEVGPVSKFVLDQNFPNPFNPSTTISFSIPEDANVSLKLYNVMGKEVKTLLQKRMTSGNHTVAIDVSDLAAGVYMYQLTAGNFTSTKKLTLLK